MNGHLDAPRTHDIEIREALPDDWQLWQRLRLAALEDSPLAFASTYAREVTFDEAFLRARLGNSHNTCLIAFQENEPVGIAGGYLREDERGANGAIAELVSMWVMPKARGRGISSVLIDAVSAWVASRGRDELRLFVSEGNDAAMRLYTRLGFALNGFTQPQPNDPTRTEREMVRRIRLES